MSRALQITRYLLIAIGLAGCLQHSAFPQVFCDPNTSPPQVDSYSPLPPRVFAGEPFFLNAHVCGLPKGSSIRVQADVLSATTGLVVYSNQAPTDINSRALVSAPSGLPAGKYTLVFSSPDAPGLTGISYLDPLSILSGGPLDGVKGLYVFLFQGTSATGAAPGAPKQTHILGSFLADGAGKITGGEADINSPEGVAEKSPLSGSYTLDDAGRGTLILQSPLGTLKFSLSFGGGQDPTIIFNGGAVETEQIIASVYTEGVLTSAPGSFLLGTGSLKLHDPTLYVQAGPPYANTIVRLQGETSCDAACRAAGGVATPLQVNGNLCLGCFPNTVADGPELYRGVFNLLAGRAYKGGLVQTGSLSATDAYSRSTMSVTMSSAGDLPQRYAVYLVDTNNEYLISLDPHTQTAVVSGKIIAENED